MSRELETDRRDETEAASPRRMDAAVRAALKARPPERRSFGNEDDMEGPRAPRSPPSKVGGDVPKPS